MEKNKIHKEFDENAHRLYYFYAPLFYNKVKTILVSRKDLF